MARLYAQAAGGLLLALGVAGFLSGGDRMLGVLNADPAECSSGSFSGMWGS